MDRLNQEQPPKGINRFITAQNIKLGDTTAYEEALSEIKHGHKYGHWIWFIFPQLKGLGSSDLAQYYGLDVEEVDDYIANDILYSRLIEITEALLTLDNSMVNIVGYIDALKIKSCMTLFYLKTNNERFKNVLDKFYDGEYCEYTRKQLEKSENK